MMQADSLEESASNFVEMLRSIQQAGSLFVRPFSCILDICLAWLVVLSP